MKRFNLAICSLIFVTAFGLSSARICYGAFTVEDEKKVGKEFYEKMSSSNVIVTDERVNEYITRLGELILSHSQKAPFDYRFFVIKSSSVNAFATPGGYVYVNSGLLALLDNESELAGVLAHEIAHVNARHIASIIDKSQKVNIATLAAILAGAFLGGGEIAAAVTGFSLATATSMNLKYTREHEEEADRLGLSYLVASGYDGQTMIDFLKKIRRYEYYSSTVPSYFLTHPGTDERIAYLDGLIQTRYPSKGAESIIGNFKRIQMVMALDENSPEESVQTFTALLNKNDRDVDALYGLALSQEKLGLVDDSLNNFRKALLLTPDDAEILRDVGIFSYKLGRSDDALSYLRKAYGINGNDDQTMLYLGKTYESQGDYNAALDLYRLAEKRNPSDPDIFYSLATAYGHTDQVSESHYYFGVYFKKKNKFESALFHFRAALKDLPDDSPRAREIKREVESLSSPKIKDRSAPRRAPLAHSPYIFAQL
ncbi:MAG: M48 family metalloprotease [Smithellaceae bacterium]|nr:M48 family metalloprotease [Smithellaceae bacterium]